MGLRLICAAVLLTACAGAGWRELRSVEGGFSVQMPGKPEMQTQARPTIYGVIHPVIYLVDHPKAQFLFNYADYPPGLVAQSTVDVILDGAVLGVVGDTGGDLQMVEKIELQGHAGRELLVAAPDGGATMRVRIYLVGERLYQQLVLYAVGEDVYEEIILYFDSLEFFPFPPPATEGPD